MIATLKFKLPEEAVEHRQALDGPAWEAVVWELDQTLRGLLKYGHEDLETVDEALENVREKLQNEMADNGLNFSP